MRVSTLPRGPADINESERTCLIIIIALYNHFMQSFGEIVHILLKFKKLNGVEKMMLVNVFKKLLSGHFNVIMKSQYNVKSSACYLMTSIFCEPCNKHK